jgi:TolB-like protein/DNA-binding SARP family transcriptional activator
MIELRTLGALQLRGPPGRDYDAVLAQPKRLALLVHLAVAHRDGFARRDTLVGLFWPDLDGAHARSALRQALTFLRRALGDDILVSRGSEEIGVSASALETDVVLFDRACDSGDFAAALQLYKGDLLDGLFVADIAPELERWIEDERARLRRRAADVAWKLVARCEAEGNLELAAEHARHGVALSPHDESGLRSLMTLLDRVADHDGAVRAYETFARRLADDLEVDPALETTALMMRVRSRIGGPPVQTKTERMARLKSPPLRRPPRSHAAPEPAGGIPVEPPQPPRSPRRRSVPYAIGAVLIIAILIAILATAAWLRATLRHRTPRPAGERSIAVLPFANVSGERQDAALVDGLGGELIAVLAKIPTLRIIALSSAPTSRNGNAGARRIADSLGVSNIFEGTVQKAGSRLRVQVRLVDARDGSTRWSETYDRELKDIFSVQSDIAGAVARELDLRLGERTLTRIKRGATRNIAAYELYLRGNDPALLRSDSGARAGLEYFRQALALDPGYAAAYAGLARMHKRIAFGDDTELSRPDRLALAEQAALKAVALDDSSGDAHATLSLVRRDNYEMAAAETELKRAVALEPGNARFREYLVQLYVLTERPADALVEGRRALELDPLSPSVNAEVAHALLANHRCDEALAQLAKLRSLRPPLLRAGVIASQCYAWKQMWPEAIAEMQRISVNAGPRGQAILGYMLGRGGRTAEARRLLAALLDRSRRTKGGAFDVALVYAGLGENDQAFIWMDRALDDRSLGFHWLPAVADGLRRDPRFDGVRQRLGLQKR